MALSTATRNSLTEKALEFCESLGITDIPTQQSEIQRMISEFQTSTNRADALATKPPITREHTAPRGREHDIRALLAMDLREMLSSAEYSQLFESRSDAQNMLCRMIGASLLAAFKRKLESRA